MCTIHFDFVGRTVLAKKVKFTTMLVPVQNSRGSTVSADHVSSVYDGKTYSVTFKKISGIFFRDVLQGGMQAIVII